MKTIDEINEKIRSGKAVVVTAEEMIEITKEKGTKKASEYVDVVTTGTFGPMCSSGMFLNVGHSKPRIKIGGGRCTLNDVPAYCGLAAVDIYIGATAMPDDDPRNMVYPGAFKYGGGHVIEEFISGRDIKLVATAYGTDCYPKKKIETYINKYNVNEAYLFNPRNSYQNYNVAVNLTNRIIYTYMGIVKPNLHSANYCSAGQLSPLLKDPKYRTIGIGTKIFLGGGVGFVTWNGTQHNPNVPRSPDGIPRAGAGTLATIGDAKQMDPSFLKGASFIGYGATMFVGLGIPIPVIDEEMAYFTSRSDEDYWAQVVDYGNDYPNRNPVSLCEVNYAQLKSGKINVNGTEVPTFPISSYSKAREIAELLKDWIISGRFLLTNPVAPLPGVGSEIKMNALEVRDIENP
ncbi:MAG TPA: homocysteine biosynthesis protein [Syntrophorhabdaceae bacterium]|nr:homocysteine biosynthesis protein [Syntrophorhabdaceae bacterium]HOL06330.1 homocysteine biosynthesis protein [Syntrophorhabdaceae bacterium]HON86080.1 homocysteine biosynthesis protein [Syntrophorhabdaceae bacterium]HPC67389.1 homocysteine biosynthesis protein [Syntrophorhabdaceae bacterium]HPP42618.1 homocysteine biosynthesis protein [Syntrophorhabdaceae bacterium]